MPRWAAVFFGFFILWFLISIPLAELTEYLLGASEAEALLSFMWKYGVPIFFVAFIITAFIRDIRGAFKKRKDERRAVELKRKREIDNEKAKMQRMINELQSSFDNWVDTALSVFESLPALINNANSCLDTAEEDFADRAFSPFWGNIKNASMALAEYNKEINRIKFIFDEYNERCKIFPDFYPEIIDGVSIPRFPISITALDKLDVSQEVTDRMAKMVRPAQCDIDFAKIFEQMKTNDILIAGFNSLSNALSGLSWTIQDSIQNLGSEIRSMGNQLNDSFLKTNSTIEDINSQIAQGRSMGKKINQSFLEVEAKRAKREEQVIQKLDKIAYGNRSFI